MFIYHFTMCYDYSIILFTHAIIRYDLYPIFNLHLIMCTYYQIVLLFHLVGSTFYLVLLKRQLKADFHSIILSIHIRFTRLLFIYISFFIRLLFIQIFIRIFVSLIYFLSHTFYSYTFHSCLFLNVQNN